MIYTWGTTGVPPASVAFSANGSNASKNTTATFTKAGTYNFQVTIQDAGGLSATSSVTVTVNQTLTTITVTPPSASVSVNGTQAFAANALDQFSAAMSPQPTITWTVSGGGSINSSGLFTAGTTVGGPFTVTAASGGKSGTAQVSVTALANNPPTVATPAAATPNPVTGTTTNLSVLGSDDGGEANLTYTWGTTGVPPASVSISANGTKAAKNTIATFTKDGSYTFQVTIKDAGNLSVTSNVTVTVNQTLTTIVVAPPSASVQVNGTQAYTANALDQFNAAMSVQPTFAWTVSGGGSINAASGLFTAGTTAGGPFTVTATSGGKSGTASVTVTNAVNVPPMIVTPAAATPNPVTGLTTALSVLGNDPGGTESDLTYTWAAIGNPPAGVSFSVNGSNASKNTQATFAKAGTYTLQVTLREPGGLTVMSNVNVTVNQTLTTFSVSPSFAAVPVNGTHGFTATMLDQFNQAMVTPPAVAWTVSGGGSIDSTGLLYGTGTTASGGPFTITGSAAGKSDTYRRVW